MRRLWLLRLAPLLAAALMVQTAGAAAQTAKPGPLQSFTELVSDYEVLDNGILILRYQPKSCASGGLPAECTRIKLYCYSRTRGLLTVSDVFPGDAHAVLKDDLAAHLTARDTTPGRPPRVVDAGRLPLRSIDMGEQGTNLTFAVSSLDRTVFEAIRLGGVLSLPESSYTFPRSAKDRANLQKFLTACEKKT